MVITFLRMLVRKVIYSILNLFDHHKEKIPNLVLQKFKKQPHLSRKDKQRIRVCINEIIRYLGLIDYLIEEINGHELHESPIRVAGSHASLQYDPG